MEAPIDSNFVKGKLGTWCVDGITPIPIAINPATGGVMYDEVSIISFTPNPVAKRDQNHVPVLMGVSSVDGTLVPIYVNAAGAILIDT